MPRRWEALARLSSPPKLVAVCAMLFFVAYAAGLGLRFNESYLRIQSNVIYNIAPLAALGLSIIPIRRSRGRERLGWICLAIVLAAWQTGDWIFTYYALALDADPPFPGWSDVAYYPGYFAFIAAIPLITFPERRLKDRRWLIDAGAVSVITGAIGFEYLMKPVAHSGGQGAFADAVALGYPVLDLALFGALIASWYAAGGKLSRPAFVLAVAVLCQVISDGIYTYVLVTTGYDNVGNPVELGWLGAYLLLAVCFALPYEPLSERRSERSSTFGLALPYVCILPIAGLVVFGLVQHQASSVLIGGAVTAVVMIVARQFLTLRDNLDQLSHAANFDVLTGLPNRRRFEEDLKQAFEGPSEGTALVLVDVDDLKSVNDSRGHGVGDELLRAMAEALQAELPDECKLSHLGGDEFCVIVSHARATKGRQTAKQILQLLRQRPFFIQGEPVRITASAGIALAPGHGTTAQDLLAHADLAKHEAKAAGGNQARLYDPAGGGQELSGSRVKWKHRITDALERDRFVLHAQPIVDLLTGEVHEYELLLRMQDGDGGLLLPTDFLDVAERFGLIYDIDRWVLRQAIGLIADQRARGRQVRLAVNLSATTFLRSDLMQMIEGNIQASGIPAESLIIEVTETAYIGSDIERVARLMNGIKRLGCQIALDDFGVGFANIRRLKHLPVDYIKIDGSFITNVSTDPVDRSLVEAMVELSRVLGKKTVAEFVENAATLELLREIGVDYGQGFYLGEPAAADELLADCDGQPSVAA